MGQSQSKRPNDPKIDDACTALAQKKYGPKYKVVSVNTKGIRVIEHTISYTESEKSEHGLPSVRSSRRIFQNKSSITVEREIKDQSAEKYSCGRTRTKGAQVSGDVSVNVGLPAAVGLSAKIGGQVQRSNTNTEMSDNDETSAQVTRFPQPPRSVHLTKTITTTKVVTIPYKIKLHLKGTLKITLQKLKPNGKTKTKSVDVVDLCPEGKTEGEKSVWVTHEGIEEKTEMEQEINIEEPGPDELMRLIHSDLLRDNREKIVEEVKDQRTLSELLEVMSSEKVVSEEQVQTISQSPSVKEGVYKLIGVLENAEPEKFLVFVNILKSKGYDKLVKLLDPIPTYPNSLKTISNLSEFGTVDHYFVTEKVSEVKDTLERSRRVIVHGICGAGKTQLLFKVAQDYKRDYASVHPGGVVWVIDGTSEKTIKDGVEKLRKSLAREADTTLKSLLDQRSHVLLLIDDLPAAKHILKELPVLNCSAKMLVTTQNSTLTLPDSEYILMKGFTEDEAVAFLTEEMSALSVGSTPREYIQQLAKSFSCLPLGLAAARGIIQECNMTVKEYKERLQNGKDAVESFMDLEEGWLQDYGDAGRNILAALQMAVNKLDNQSKAMLQHCAFLVPQNIPVLILKEALEGEHPASDLRFVRDLKRFSLGNIEGEGVKRRLSIHGVTQMAIRLHMEKEQQTTCINKLLQILVKFFVKDMTYSEMHKFSVSLMPHVEAALKHADKLKLGAGDKLKLGAGDKLKLGAEYPLMKARLLMVYGHLLIQKGTPGLSKQRVEEAKESLLQFAGMLSAKSVERNPDYHITSKDLYQSLANKSQSLKDGLFEETVIRRAITRQNLIAVSDKLGAEHSTTRKLENMVDNFEPLTMEMYKTLVDSNLAIPVEKLKRNFLPELYISILFTLNKALFDAWDGYSTSIGFVSWDRLIILALDMCTEVTNETGVLVLVRFLADSVSLSSVKVTDMVMSHLHVQGNKELFKDKGIATEDIMTSILLKVVETLSLHETKGATRSYDFGLLSGDGDTLLKLNYYENVMLCCVQAIQQAEEGTKLTPIITWGQDTCKEMLELVESESQAGNPPHKRAEYYMTAGLFNVAVRELEKAAEMFRKAYKVELEREEYHGRMGDALRCLIQVRIAQKELRKARVSVRRLLQLSKDHWHEKVPYAEEELRMVRCRIAFQAIKENMEKGKAVCEYVTTV